jgi:hypothetical protein
MHSSVITSMEALKTALLSLPATGEAGFEGLISVALSKISGFRFRLARSGSQFGVDGKSAEEEDGVCFEGKRYDEVIPKDQILSKIVEVSIHNKNVDLWILGATSSVSAQLADGVREAAKLSGISTLILDWSANDLPQLAVALAMAPEATKTFLHDNLRDNDVIVKALAALELLQTDEAFLDRSTRIKVDLQEPTLGAGIARRANADWLTTAFSSKEKGRRLLGQPLAPGDNTDAPSLARSSLIARLAPHMDSGVNTGVVVVHGEEGNGKSWLVAQTWLWLKAKPLMIVLSPDEFIDATAATNYADLFIRKLVEQTDKQSGEKVIGRWQRKLRFWRSQPKPSTPRLVVLIDGLNQRLKVDWARRMSEVASELEDIGGKLVITVRSAFFENRIERRLLLPIEKINVPEWNECERDEILARHDVKASKLNVAVATALKNPRLLGIALELLKKTAILQMEDLNVSRLLFEHMRSSERDATSPQLAHEFAKTLQDHAKTLLLRLKSEELDDLQIFEGGLQGVTDGRFFQPVVGDATRYTLSSDSLTLALAFSIVDKSRAALRNNRQLGEELDAIIEPVSALDETSNVIVAALIVSCLDPSCDRRIASALIAAFAKLQNPSEEHFNVFVALAKTHPVAFMDAAKLLCLSGGDQPNFDWIEAALMAAKLHDEAWQLMKAEIASWLCQHSLAPELRMHTREPHNSAIEVSEERAGVEANITKTVQSLSQYEIKLLSSLTRIDDGDLNLLARCAFMLIAGKPIAEFSVPLVNWCFGQALNSDYRSPTKEFLQLVRFNRLDWLFTRDSLLQKISQFEAANTSTAGRWALVTLLQATGHPDEATKARALIHALDPERIHLRGGRSIEHCCATDPCDPGSSRPDNIEATSLKYAAVDPTKVRVLLGMSQEDHYFFMARSGMARFEPGIAIDKHKALIADVMRREGISLHYGLFEIHANSALISRDEALKLVETSRLEATEVSNSREDSEDDWIDSQFRLLTAFPQLSGSEQLSSLLSMSKDDDILLNVMNVTKPLDGDAFGIVLQHASDADDERAQYVTLAFANWSNTPIGTSAIPHLTRLISSSSSRVRAQTMAIIAKSNSSDLLNLVVDSGWSATTAEKDREANYGSLALVEATARKLISSTEAIERISPIAYAYAARKLDIDAAKIIGSKIDVAIKRAASISIEHPNTNIELKVGRRQDAECASYYLSERQTNVERSLEDFSNRNNRAKYAEQQKLLHDAFNDFKGTVERENAQIILDNIDINDFETIVAAEPKLADDWYVLLSSLPKHRLAGVHNISLLIAQSIAKENPKKAAKLFNLVDGNTPFVRVTFGVGAITLDAKARWLRADSSEIRELCFMTMDRARNDHELAIEVLAGTLCNKEALLRMYVERLLGLNEPATTCRALMVVGFSTRNDFNDEILALYQMTHGFIGAARKAAQYAYDRNIWSEHWFNEMRNSKTAHEFWRSSVLFTKIVDGRIDVWKSAGPTSEGPFGLFYSSLEDRINNRVRKWRDLRKEKLFGDDVPSLIFAAN